MNQTEHLVSAWEDQRTVKNLMGKYVNCVLLNREHEIFERFWANRADVSLMLNDGAYVGAKKVAAYYAACRDRNALVASLLQKRFPAILGGKSEDELYGIGPFKVKPLACPVIEVAEDGETAKGLWYCQGAYNEVEECGPVARWTWGYFAVDFAKDGGHWKIWHLQYLNDVNCICGQSWATPQKELPKLPEFAALGEFTYPEYSVKQCFRPYYTVDTQMSETPRIPEPYKTFADTFSYGVGEEE